MSCVELSLTSKIPTAQVIHLTWSLLIAVYRKDNITMQKVGGATMHTHLHSLMLTPSVAIGDLSVLFLIKYSTSVVLPLAGPPTTSNFIW